MGGVIERDAHQLGTPISSLIAWVEYLRTKDIDPSLLTEMDKDVKRLQTIAERFSKIGFRSRSGSDKYRGIHPCGFGIHGDPYFLEGENQYVFTGAADIGLNE